MTPRFYTDLPLHVGTTVALNTTSNHHALKVLRLQTGQRVQLFNGDGTAYGGILHVESKRGSVAIDSIDSQDQLGPRNITLVQGLCTSEKLDWVLEKTTELGVDSIILVQTERSKIRLDHEREQKKMQRWHDVLIAACEQCGRNTVPSLNFAESIRAAYPIGLDPNTMDLVLAPGASQELASIVYSQALGQGLRLWIGPESGLSPSELHYLHEQAARATTLGWRILRTETAGLVALSTIQAICALKSGSIA
jgi:16S rRNA (uracil1498-N3)-methyltransferase